MLKVRQVVSVADTCSGQLKSKNYYGCCTGKRCKRGYGGCSRDSECDDGLECVSLICISNPGFAATTECCYDSRSQERRGKDDRFVIQRQSYNQSIVYLLKQQLYR